MSVVIETTLGDITVDLYLEQRPVTCLNFLKLCKMKYYNFNLFHSIRSGFIAQTGDPTAEGFGGQSIFGLLEGPEKRFFSGEKLPKIRHTNTGTLSMVCTEDMMVGSQFFFTLAPDLDSLDGIHCVIGEVTEGHDVLRMLNDVICDETHRPYRDVRITHTVVLEDPFNDPTGLRAPSRSPSPSAERLKGGRIAPDEDIDEAQGKSAQEIQELIEEKEAKARATILEIVGDLPDADIAPPENVLFVCKLNPVTTDEDLEIIFSRFGKIVGCEVIRDKKTGDSLQYAFIEFSDKKSCEDAYFKMDNVLIDDRRIHVDFSQSVSRMRWMGKGKGIRYFNNESKDQNQNNHASKQHYKERGDHKNGSFDGFNRRKHENHNREHHRNKNDRENRDKKRENMDLDKERDKSRTQRSRSRSRVEKPGNKSRYDRERSTSKPRNIKTDLEKIKSHKERSSSKSRRAKDTSSNRDRSRSRSKLDRSQKESSQIKENKNKSMSQISESETSRKERDKCNSRSKTNKSHDESLNHRDKRHQSDDKYQRSHGRSHRNDSEKDNRHKRDHSDSGKITSDYERTKKSESSKDKSMKHCETDHSKIGESNISNIDKSRHKDDKEKSVRHRTENSNKNLEEKDTQSSKDITERKGKNSKMVDKSKKKNTKILKKKRKHSTSSSDSSSESSSSESSSSSGGDKRKKSLKRRKKKVSTSSSSSSSSSSTSSSSTDSSSFSSSSDSEPSRKKRKKVVSSKIVKTKKSKKK